MYEVKYHGEDINKYNFLITGGAGFIGSNIVEYLLKYGAKKVRVIDNFSTGFRKNISGFLSNSAFELLEGDIRNIEACKNAVEGINCVFHQAALGSVPRSIDDPITTNDVNITGFLNMLVASRDEKVTRFVYAASSSTYGDHSDLPKIENRIGDPLSPYAITKYVNELYADIFSKIYNFQTIGLRYFNIFGPRQNPDGDYAAVIPIFIQAALTNKPIVINGDGETTRDFTFVENAVQANIKAAFSPVFDKHEIYNVACGDQITLNMLVEMLAALKGDKLNVSYRAERVGDVRHSKASIDKISKQLGYYPAFKFKQGLELVYRSYANELNQVK